jgi:hypothetical protein
MKSKFISYSFSFTLFGLLSTAPVIARSAAALVTPEGHAGPQYAVQGSVAASSAPQAAAVSYASVSQVNGLLSQLESASKASQDDLAKLRIEKWKTDGSTKKQTLGNVDSIQRNLQSALPEIIGQLRNSPEDLAATFRLYRNLDALYDVMTSVAESAGAFGSKDEFQSISNDLSSFEGTRRQLADRLANLATSKEQEIVRLRTDLKTAQAATPPKKTIVDDDEPPKKPAKKKATTKKPATTQPTTTPQAALPQQPKQ